MKQYIQLDMYVLTLKEQDIVTTSGFLGKEEDNSGFGNPNDEGDPINFEN